MSQHQTAPARPGYTVADLGTPAQWKDHSTPHPLSPTPVRGKKFLTADLGLTGMEVSVNSLPPGRAVPFLHKHRRHEELYLFIAGEGEFLADGERIPVQAGTAVRVAPDVARSWRSTGNTPLHYIVVQATEGSLAATTTRDGVPCGGNPWND